MIWGDIIFAGLFDMVAAQYGDDDDFAMLQCMPRSRLSVTACDAPAFDRAASA